MIWIKMLNFFSKYSTNGKQLTLNKIMQEPVHPIWTMYEQQQQTLML